MTKTTCVSDFNKGNMYYAVYISPCKAAYQEKESHCAESIAEASASNSAIASDSPLWLIFREKIHALNALRHFKDARMREFPNQEQAESYVRYGFESIEFPKSSGKTKSFGSKSISIGSKSSSNSMDDTNGSFSPTGKSTPIGIDGINSIVGSIQLSSSPTALPDSGIITNGQQHQQELSVSGGERQQFRTPSKQELQEFRRQIERGNLKRVKQIVWDNPRYLISIGDTPTCLTEGCRYNALHICAQEDQPKIAELLLKTISDQGFTQLYAGKKGSSHMFSTLNDNLLDYYLNMPDNVRGETPLHLAAKHGHANVAEVLVAYPQYKSLMNADGLQPKDLISKRTAAEAIKKLEVLLCDPYYVPVLRSEANELPPQVGKPFSSKHPANLQPKYECDILGVRLFVSAMAGPMSREKAINFYKRWKMPTLAKLSESNNNDIVKVSDTCLGDNLSLKNLEKERHIKNSDSEKGLEMVGRQLATQELLDWREYWDFLGAFVDIRTPEGLDQLEAHLVKRMKEDQVMNLTELMQCLNAVASEEQQQLERSVASTAQVVPTFTEFQTPYTCVEKSLQVFAKRITKTLIINLQEVTINDMLLGELKRLKNLVASFRIDDRFTHVDFSKVHSRIANLVASYVYDSQEVHEAMRLHMLQMLRKLIQLLAADERGREQHLGCWCSSLLQKLEQTPGSTAINQLPNAVNTEKLYINAWEAEHSCPCQWVVPHNLSRKSSRRKRTESLRAAVAAAAVTASEDNDKTVYYDCLETLTSCDDGTSSEEENFKTPPESRTPQWTYQLYIYGKEPTKRDADVLNAIINVDVDEETRPHVYAWRTNMEIFSASELELFPSLKIVQKTIKSQNWGASKSKHLMPTKKLLASPKRSIQPPAAVFGNSSSPLLSFQSIARPAGEAFQMFKTPPNKMRGTFSKYRTSKLDS